MPWGHTVLSLSLNVTICDHQRTPQRAFSHQLRQFPGHIAGLFINGNYYMFSKYNGSRIFDLEADDKKSRGSARAEKS
jgi:hypothetical protein